MGDFEILLTALTFIGALYTIFRPIVKFNRAVEKLEVTLDYICKDCKRRERENEKEHDEFCSRLDEHEDALVDHDKRLCKIEYKDMV